MQTSNMVSEFGTFSNPAVCGGASSNAKHSNKGIPYSATSKLHTTSWAQAVFKLNPRLFNVLVQDLEESKPTAATTSVLSVTIPFPVTSEVVLALIYSYIPFAMFFGFFAWFIVTEKLVPLYGTILLLFTSLTSEGILKNIFRQPRPFESAVESYGMPSSHCMTSYAMLTWIIGDTTLSSISVPSKIAWIVLILILLAPVPWARYFLGDHSISQCVAGCAGGLICGFAGVLFWWYLFLAGAEPS